LKLFWIAIGGEKDIVYQNRKNMNTLLDKHGIKYKRAYYPAGHHSGEEPHTLAPNLLYARLGTFQFTKAIPTFPPKSVLSKSVVLAV
jgi:hypothetical protein